MSCCSEFVTIGCVDACTATDIGYNAVQTGSHTFEVRIGQGTWLTKEVTFTSGNDLIMPAVTLPETGDHDLKIKQPDGTYYAFSTGVTCARISTQIYTPIVT